MSIGMTGILGLFYKTLSFGKEPWLMCDNVGSSGHLLTHYYLHNLLSILSAIFKRKHKATNNVGNRVIENDSIHIKRF